MDGATSTPDSIFSKHDIDAELLALKQDLLRAFLVLALCLGWLAYPVSVFRGWDIGLGSAISATLLLGTYISYLLTHQSLAEHYHVGCWALVLSMTIAYVLFVASRQSLFSKTLSVLLIIAANALVGKIGALLVAIASWSLGSAAAAPAFGLGTLLDPSRADLLFLNLITLGVSIMASGPLTISADWALHGWARAAKALTDARERRAELYRVVRALDEASYRIQRMNDELVTARREAEMARVMKARFAAMVSHELRGPLNLILGYSKMMALSPENYSEPLPTDYRADVATIYRNSQHLTSLLDDVLDLSRIEAERLPLVKEPVDLEEDVVEAAVHVVEPLARRKGLYLRAELTRALPKAIADAVRLRQVLLNLLTNALRFTDTGGIVVRTRERDNAVLITVQDTGMGISEKELPRLFQEFTQVVPAQRGKASNGSGLGLVISKQLVELHGGEIWADSAPGKGTTISFTIPLLGRDPTAVKAIDTRQSGPGRQRENTCLVVHQDTEVIRLLARYTEKSHIVGTSDVHGLPGLVEELHPVAILTDVANAETVTKQLSSAAYDVPVVSWEHVQLAAHRSELGVMAYLIKPISGEVIHGVMRQLERNGETTILLVDDDRDAVRLVESALRSLPRPYRILRAYDGTSALALIKESRPDVVFIDLLMPGMSGEEVIARIRRDDELRDIAVVITSALDPVSVEVAAMSPITVRCKRPLRIRQAVRCIEAIVHELQPDYLSTGVPNGAHEGGLPG